MGVKDGRRQRQKHMTMLVASRRARGDTSNTNSADTHHHPHTGRKSCVLDMGKREQKE